jgi:hypothetical protein
VIVKPSPEQAPDECGAHTDARPVSFLRGPGVGRQWLHEEADADGPVLSLMADGFAGLRFCVRVLRGHPGQRQTTRRVRPGGSATGEETTEEAISLAETLGAAPGAFSVVLNASSTTATLSVSVAVHLLAHTAHSVAG